MKLPRLFLFAIVTIIALLCTTWFISNSYAIKNDVEWDVEYYGNKMPQHPWGGSIREKCSAGIKDNKLHVIDNGIEAGQMVNFAYAWSLSASDKPVIEVSLKVLSCTARAAVVLLLANGEYDEDLTFHTDRITLGKSDLSYMMDTTNAFHCYRVEISDKDIKVFVDGKLAINGIGKFTGKAHQGRNQICFGSMSSNGISEALWEYVKFQKGSKSIVKRGTLDDNVKVLKTQIIYESKYDINFPWATRFSDEAIWLRFSVGSHMRTERGGQLWSLDNGKTWETPSIPSEKFEAMRLCKISDNATLGIGGWAEKATADRTYPFPIVRYNNIRGSEDPKLSRTSVNLPWNIETLNIHRSLLRAANGDLIASAYGKVKGERHFRAFCIRSQDNGNTWSYLSTIASNIPDPVAFSEGYNESVIVRLENGNLLSLIRTGGPLMQTYSTNNGLTWAEPVMVNDYGVDPHALVLSNGILLASFGRPGVSLLVDLNGQGKKWDGLVDIYKGYGCGYTSMVEIEPGMVMLFYTESAFIDKGLGHFPLNRLMAAYIKVSR
jgi:hypothetical protein